MENCKHDSLYYVFIEVIRMHYYRTHTLLEKIGVYPGQPPLLIALYHKDGQSQKELSEKLKVKPSTITVMLKRLEKSNIIQRKMDEVDQRVSRVYLTDEGKKVCMELNEVIKIINKECFKNFTIDEQVILRRLFMQMKENLSIEDDTKKQ